MYSLDTNPIVDKTFSKLEKKNPKQLKIITKKIKQILKDPYHFKPLKGDMHEARRVHVGSFVLVYEINKKTKTIILLDYDYHDKIY